MPNYVKNNGYLILYINKISVIADKAYEVEDDFNESIWGLETASTTDYGKRQEKALEEREILRAREKALMVSESDAK